MVLVKIVCCMLIISRGKSAKIFVLFYGEMAELVEGARLLSECSEKSEPWVRIPLSPLFN